MKRRGIVVSAGVAAFVLGLGVTLLLLTVLNTKKANDSTPQKPTSPSVKVPDAKTLRFAAMGDMLAHDSVVANAKTASGYDFTRYFSKIKNTYSNADIVFCNPETPAAGEKFGISGYPTFNAPTEFSRDLSKVGCNMINLATNHMYDKGQAGVEATIDGWNQQKPLLIAGANKTSADSGKISYVTKNGITVAFLAFMDFSNSPVPNNYVVETYHDEAKMRAKLVEARKKADLVIVSAHWGTEDSTRLNDDQRRTAQLFADEGVDVVIGTGPHVLQSVATLKNAAGHSTLVWYSIGNMLSSQLAVNELTSGIATFEATKKDGKISVSKLGFHPTFMAYDWSTADRAAQRLSTRTNLMLYPLSDADDRIKAMFPSESLESRQKFITDTLGTETSVTFSP